MSAARFLALGDSYTIGEGVGSQERWPERLVQILRADGVVLDEPEIVAQTGWTSDELERGINARDPRGPFALVTLLIGVNDQYRARQLAGFRLGLGRLVERAVSLAEHGGRSTMLISIPDWGVTPFAEGRDRDAIALSIDAFNAAVRAAASRAGAHFADITAISRQHPRAVVADGLHPDAEVHAAWARALAGTASAILRHH
jgi:lysophospholipase L1-like esterase